MDLPHARGVLRGAVTGVHFVMQISTTRKRYQSGKTKAKRPVCVERGGIAVEKNEKRNIMQAHYKLKPKMNGGLVQENKETVACSLPCMRLGQYKSINCITAPPRKTLTRYVTGAAIHKFERESERGEREKENGEWGVEKGEKGKGRGL